MCGRAFQSYSVHQLLRLAGTKLIQNPDTYRSSYNIGPTDYLPVVCRREKASDDEDSRVLAILKWGYESPFKVFIINARAEELQYKRTFQPLMDTRRCVAIVQGYFQWNSRREPYVFRPKTEEGETQATEGDQKEECFYLAALQAKDDTVIICTRESIGTYHDIHPRMPVILKEEEIDKWLNPKNKFEDIQEEILDEKSDKWHKVTFYQVAPLVGNVREKSDKVLTKAGEFEEQVDDEGILRYFSPVRDDNFDSGQEDNDDKKEDKNKGKEESDEKERTGILKFFEPVDKDKVQEEKERMFKKDEKGDDGYKKVVHQTDLLEFFPPADEEEKPEEERAQENKEEKENDSNLQEDAGNINRKQNKAGKEQRKGNTDNASSEKASKKEPMKEASENIIIEEAKGQKISDMIPEIQKKLNESGKKYTVKRAVVITIEDEKDKSSGETFEGKRNQGKDSKKRKEVYEKTEEDRGNLRENKQVKKNVS